MLDSHTFEKIRGTFRDVMEMQVFMTPEARSPVDLACERGVDFLHAHMRFAGSPAVLRTDSGAVHVHGRSGSLTLVMPEAMAVEIAANFLGVDADDPAADVAARDALKELLNIVCGNVLTALYGQEAVFDLEIPEASEAAFEDVAEIAGTVDAMVFDVEGWPVLLRADLAPAPPSSPERRA
jgi:hypothetical protein